jgi:hypothetical protein
VAVGARTRREGRAVAAQDEGLAIPEEPALPGGEDSAAAEEVFEAGEEGLSAGLVSGRQQVLGQPLGDGVGLGGIASLGGLPLGLFVLQVAPMAALALRTGADVRGTRRRIRTIFEPVNKGREGADGGCLEGRKAGDLRQARMSTQVVGPLRETFGVPQEHQEEGPEHTERVIGRPSTRARSIERTQEGAGGVQIEAQEHERGFVPGLGQGAGLAAQPALERLGQGLAILSMR